MRRTIRLLLLPIALISCFGGGKKPPGKSGPSADEEWLKPLQGLKVVRPVEKRTSDGRTTFAVGQLEGTLPDGFTSMTVGGQTTYHSSDFQETLRITGYVSEAPLDEVRQRAIASSMTELTNRAEHLMAKLGLEVKLSTPLGGHPPWGVTTRFSAVGPLNRVSLHYGAVAAHEALVVQIDGNTMTDTPARAVALIDSIHFAKGDAADPTPTAKTPAP